MPVPLDLFAPDLILVNGVVHTVDADSPLVSAVAIRDGRFVATGTDEEIRALAGPGTVVEDLGGAAVVPGLIDAHNHMQSTGIMLREVQLFDTRAIPEIVARVAERVKSARPGEWIVGRGWDESLLAEGRHPNRHDLDAVSPDNPVVIHRVWNKLVCNSAALRAVGIDRNTPDPPADVLYSGSFERDSNGDPTGLFRDRAKDMITDNIPPYTEEQRVAGIAEGCRAFNATGLTGVAEPGLYPNEIAAYTRARREGKLTVRTDMLIAAWGFGAPETEGGLEENVAFVGTGGSFGDDLLRLEGVKFMIDGGMSDRTARMFEPYLDQPDHRGTWVVEPTRLVKLIRYIHDLGWPMDIHTCGDEAQEVVVSAFADAQRDNPKPWLRHRVHHAYFPTETALKRMAEAQISAVVSSPFLTNLGEGFVNSVGPERASRAMPMRTYLDAGVPLAGSSDSYITDFNPWVGMHAAVNRHTVTGRDLGKASEALTPAEALHSYTMGGAFAVGREDRVGSITPGKLADLVVLDRDPLAVDPATLDDVAPTRTMLGGEWVWGA
ncbi:MAG: amidohydrolase family protein [Thermomicrobiales bacterium]|nr:amidohydrolase family protein [Thermomicrobiales bacterium]